MIKMTLSDVSASIAVTTGPIAGSTKIYRDGVPFRRVNLSNGEHLDLYDTSGPYTDPHAVIDLHAGLPSRAGARPAAAGGRRRGGRVRGSCPVRARPSRCGPACPRALASAMWSAALW